jgi:hypothetical protein
MSTLEDLPYAQEYIRDILRPRVERAIQLVDRSMTESVWQHVVRILAADQPTGDAQSPAIIRKLLEESLGLRMAANVNVSFEPGAEPPSEPRPQVQIRSMPLVGAVLGGDRKAR